jgi:hypothetical protein
VAAIPEFVNEECGVLAGPDEAVTMANGIAEMYENPDVFERKSKAASARVRQQSDANKIINLELKKISKKYIIAKSFYGLGGNLSVLSCAWVAARKLNRYLIIDWRGMHYGCESDYFHKLFKPLSLQASLSEISNLEADVFPHYWKDFVMDIPNHQKGINLTAANSDLLFDPQSGFSPENQSIAVVSRDGKFFHKREYLSEMKEFFAELKPIDTIDADISAFVGSHFKDFTIGVHFRHGNGEPTVVVPDFDWFCKSIDELCTGSDRSCAPILIATDCGAALDMFRIRYGDRIVCYPKFYPPNGTGGMHYRQTGEEKLKSAVEAVIDIRLLSLCSAFVGSKSFFSVCASHWGKGFNRCNSRWFVPRLRAFKPADSQIHISSDTNLVETFGLNYPNDNLYYDKKTHQLFFQDVIVGNIDCAMASLEELDRVKQKIFLYRLY